MEWAVSTLLPYLLFSLTSAVYFLLPLYLVLKWKHRLRQLPSLSVPPGRGYTKVFTCLSNTSRFYKNSHAGREPENPHIPHSLQVQIETILNYAHVRESLLFPFRIFIFGLMLTIAVIGIALFVKSDSPELDIAPYIVAGVGVFVMTLLGNTLWYYAILLSRKVKLAECSKRNDSIYWNYLGKTVVAYSKDGSIEYGGVFPKFMASV